jgi:anti-sigma B factor antagonist
MSAQNVPNATEHDVRRAPVSGRREVVVRPSGEIDLATAELFRDQLIEAIAAGPTCLVVDMTEVTFINSSGLAKLVAARDSLVPNGQIILRNVAPSIRRVLEFADLVAGFPIEDARGEPPGTTRSLTIRRNSTPIPTGATQTTRHRRKSGLSASDRTIG